MTKQCILALSLAFAGSSCTNLPYPNRPIRLKPVQDSAFIVYSNAEVELHYSKAEILAQVEFLEKSSKDFPQILNSIKAIRKDTSQLYYLALQIGDVYKLDPDRVNVWATLGESYFTLLKQGRLRVFNKEGRLFEKKIYRQFWRDNLGSTAEVFKFRNKKRFFSYITGLGE